MPNFKKNAVNQIMFPMVDKTDFATIESAITASDFNSAATKKIFGVNHGVSDAFTSATISKAATLVHSGIFQQTLKAAECNYDYLIVRFTHPSCADQILVFQPQEIDPSDTWSMLSDFMSDLQSRVPKLVATNSQVSDLVSDLRSYLVGMSGMQSDIYSNLSDFKSDFQSRVPKLVANNSQLSDLASDLRSYLAGMSGVLSDVYSNLAAGVLLGASALSDVGSNVWAHATGAATASRVLLNLSRISDVYSQLSDFRSNVGVAGVPLTASDISDLRSAIAAVSPTLTVSDISDIASAVWANTLGAAVSSRVLLNLSRISDVYSLLSDFYSDFGSRIVKAPATASMLSDFYSDFLSKVPKAPATASGLSDALSDLRSFIGAGVPVQASDMSDLRSAIAGITVSVGASDISDIASAVWANAIGARVDSRVLLALSQASDVYSLLSDFYSDYGSRIPKAPATASVLSDFYSDFQSRVPKLVANYSQLSDIGSDLKSAVGNISVTLTASDISDIASATAAGITTLGPSDISDIASAVWAYATGARIDSRVLLNLSRISDVYSLLSGVDSNLQSRIPKAVATNSQLSDLASDLRSFMAGLSGTASDIYSLLSDVQSDFQSRVPKQVAASSQVSDLMSGLRSFIGAGVPVSASDMSDLRSAITAGGLSVSNISDIASAVWADTIGARVDSRILVNQSRVSDIYSLLSDVQSDFQSRVPRAVATNSQLSDLASDLRSYLVGLSGTASDIYSNLAAGVTVSTIEAAAIDAIHDEVVEGTLTLRQVQRILLAALAGKASGGSTTTITFRDVADTKARITATVDADGNRTAMTLDGA